MDVSQFTSFFCIFTMLMTMRCADADTVPAIMQYLSGNGSIAYGTKIMKSIYQTMHSRSSKPTPSPIKPAVPIVCVWRSEEDKKKNEKCMSIIVGGNGSYVL